MIIFKKSKRTSFKEKGEEDIIDTPVAPEPVNPTVKFQPDKFITAQIKKYAGDFEGLYESLYVSYYTKDRCITDAYEEWHDRIESLDGEEAFISAFSETFPRDVIYDEEKCREKIGELLETIYSAGITRSFETNQTVKTDETNMKFFRTLDGKRPEIDKEYTVFKVVWINGEQIVENGILVPKN